MRRGQRLVRSLSVARNTSCPGRKPAMSNLTGHLSGKPVMMVATEMVLIRDEGVHEACIENCKGRRSVIQGAQLCRAQAM